VSLVGQIVLERYLLEEKLGEGAMGTVYRGKHLKLPRKVAVKVLHPHLVHQRNMVKRFVREATLAARLQHPNVISVIDFGQSDSHQVMVLELAQGRPLRSLMTGPLAGERIIGLVRPILRGLEHAHGVGLIHRDLKPENIMVEVAADGSEVPRIVDFGIAVLRDPDENIEGGKLTATGQVLGTPIYMAPEQAKCETFDHRIDLFALGVMVYEMVSGRQPFDGTAMEIAVANITDDPPPIAKRAPGVQFDRVLEAFARKLMARSLDHRIASASDALELLELLERDRATASLQLGITDVAKASGIIALPSLPSTKR
jgi:serine/threonine protein kinase